ncbi:phage tail tape measure protein [Lonsdalea quercina]|uniref:phage tail tape measure protein n=1 Tax=Lonsdalea quercina TaxID=71657 RepID=UPI0039762C01
MANFDESSSGAAAFRQSLLEYSRSMASFNQAYQRMMTSQVRMMESMARAASQSGRHLPRLNDDLQDVSRIQDTLTSQQIRLLELSEKYTALSEQREALRADLSESVDNVKETASPIVDWVKAYAEQQASLRNITVSSGLSGTQEQQIADALREYSLQSSQRQSALTSGLETLIEGGVDPMKGKDLLGVVGTAAAATQADIKQMAQLGAAFNTLKFDGKQAVTGAFDHMLSGAKAGDLDVASLSSSLPELAGSFEQNGITGDAALSQIVSSLAVGKAASGSDDTAVANLKGWLESVNSNDIGERYASAGVNYQASMADYIKQGFSTYEASLMIGQRLIDDKGEKFKSEWQAAVAKGDMATQERLMAKSGLSKVFDNNQAVSHLLNMRQNWDDYQQNKQAMLSPEAEGTMARDASAQNNTLKGQWQHMQVAGDTMSLSVGEALAPALMAVGDAVMPVLDGFARWLQLHPGLIQAVVVAQQAFSVFKAVFSGVRYALNLLHSGLTLAQSVFTRFGGALRQGVLAVGRVVMGGMRVVSGLVRSGLSLALSGIMRFGGALGRGLLIAGRAVMVFGRALLMNPIGLLITGIAVGAYLIYRYWEPISNWFSARWEDVKKAFRGGIGGVSKLLLNWSPIGIIYKLFAAVLSYFNIKLPSNLSNAGGKMIGALSAAISRKWGSVKAVFSGFGSSLSQWASELWEGLKTNFSGGIGRLTQILVDWSPIGIFHKLFEGVLSYFGVDLPASFSEFGSNLIGSLISGITDKWEKLKSVVSNLGSSISGWFNDEPKDDDKSSNKTITQREHPVVTPPPARKTAADVPQMPATTGANANAKAGAGEGLKLSFSPTIHVNGQPATATPEIKNALNLSLHELEKMMQKVMEQQQRRGYA